ncbi:nucleolar transcription factor 1-like isoform X2 [Onthophagus taurus]|uniref:nucleolar transcription factor 1-like isoform X2 n=1 Tax=Onthophagus taurus TaxID=166361 RepID=UPI000C1FFC7D|nr:nucleolar transcription factor 1-like isoform X2 [Onthophagus taurus]
MGHSKRTKKDQNSTSKRYEEPESTTVAEKKPKNVEVDRKKRCKRTKKQAKNFKTVQKVDVVEEDEEFASDSNEASQDSDKKFDRNVKNEKKVQDVNKNKKRMSVISEDITFPEKDLNELLQRMLIAIPENDCLLYNTRVEKLNWDDISFKKYTGDECKSQWLLLQSNVRRFRLLSELIQSAKDLIHKPGVRAKNSRHPDMPKRPLSSFMLFAMDKRNKIRAENPDLEVTEISKIATQMYKALPPSKKEKYIKEAAEKRKVYDAEMLEFNRLHPETENPTRNTSSVPKKPNTPFMLFYESELENLDKKTKDKDSNKEFKDLCKEKWKDMTDKKKVIYINWSLDQENKYYDELKMYKMQNPNFVPLPKKSVLTKEEKMLRERIAGKPLKPPNSAYSLYSRMMLQSDEIKNINPKDRMVYIADKWKSCSDEEKKDYNDRIVHLREQYKLDFASYLESLPEEKRQEEIRNTLPKRKRNIKNEEIALYNKKVKTEDENDTKLNKENVKKSKLNPESGLDNGKHEKKKVSKKDEPFSKPPYWNRMKKDEKQSFRTAMLKLRKHLESKFEYHVDDRDSVSSGEEENSWGEASSSDSSSDESS